MKKKNLKSLNLNKKLVSKFTSQKGGANQVPAQTLHAGYCQNTGINCCSGLCVTAPHSYLCTQYPCDFKEPPSLIIC